MRAVLQRVLSARVLVDEATRGEIGAGLLVLLGAGEGDLEADLDYIFEKSVNLRVFADEAGKMNLSVRDVGGDLMVVSQFTLYGDARRGRRPSFTSAMRPEGAEALYEAFIERARAVAELGHVAHGVFGADMQVELVNDGPVTLLLDSSKAL